MPTQAEIDRYLEQQRLRSLRGMMPPLVTDPRYSMASVKPGPDLSAGIFKELLGKSRGRLAHRAVNEMTGLPSTWDLIQRQRHGLDTSAWEYPLAALTLAPGGYAASKGAKLAAPHVKPFLRDVSGSVRLPGGGRHTIPVGRDPITTKPEAPFLPFKEPAMQGPAYDAGQGAQYRGVLEALDQMQFPKKGLPANQVLGQLRNKPGVNKEALDNSALGRAVKYNVTQEPGGYAGAPGSPGRAGRIGKQQAADMATDSGAYSMADETLPEGWLVQRRGYSEPHEGKPPSFREEAERQGQLRLQTNYSMMTNDGRRLMRQPLLPELVGTTSWKPSADASYLGPPKYTSYTVSSDEFMPRSYQEVVIRDPKSSYSHPHWPEKGVKIHYRTHVIDNDDGRFLYVDEIQSDEAQYSLGDRAGPEYARRRKLAYNNMIKESVDAGYDGIVITDGRTQVLRNKGRDPEVGGGEEMRVAYDAVNERAHVFDEDGYELATHNWGYSELEDHFGTEQADEIWRHRREPDRYAAQDIAYNDFHEMFEEKPVYIETTRRRDPVRIGQTYETTQIHTEDEVEDMILKAKELEDARMAREPTLPGIEPPPNRYEDMDVETFAQEKGFDVEERWFENYNGEMLQGTEDEWIEDQTENILENWDDWSFEDDMDNFAVNVTEGGGGRPMQEGDDGWGFLELYDKIIPNEVRGVLKGLDKKAKVGNYSFDYDTVGAVGRELRTGDNAVHGTLIPITDKMRETVKTKGMKSPY